MSSVRRGLSKKDLHQKVDALVREHFVAAGENLSEMLKRRAPQPRPLRSRVQDALVEVAFLGKPLPDR